MKTHINQHTPAKTWAVPVLAVLSLGLATVAPAANFAWSTAPTTAKFADNNWTSGTTPGTAATTPATGDSLFFGTSSITGLTNNQSTFTYGGVTFNAGASAFSINGNAFALAAGGGVTNNSSATQSITNVISGAGKVVQAGTGTLVLGGANTYSAGTIVSAGTLVANNAAALGALGAATVNGTLDLNAGAVTYTGLTNGLSGNGTVNVTVGATSANSILTSAYGNYAGFTGTINVGLNGVTSASSATVPASGKGVIFASMGAANINILSNATLYVSGTVTNAANTVLYGGTMGEVYGQLRLDGSVLWTGPITLAGSVAGGTSGTIGGNSGTPTITGNITETGGSKPFVKVGAANLVLAGSNTWSGPTIVNGGTLTLIGNQTNITGSFYVGTNTTAESLSIGTTTQTTPTTFVVSSNATVVTGSAGTSFSTINVFGAAGYPTVVTNNGTLFTGRDSGFGVNAYATWQQNSNMTVTGNGGYPGNWTLGNGGTFNYAGVNPIVVSPGSSGSGTLTINGNFTTSQGFNFTNTGTTGSALIVLGNGGPGVLNLAAQINQLIVTNGAPNTNPYALQIGTNATINIAGYSVTNYVPMNNASGQAGALTINGGGIFALTGISTYTGGTTVNGTTLVLGAGGSPGAVRNNLTLNSNAVLLLTQTDALGYYGGLSVTNVAINGSTVTNAAGNEGYNASFVLNGGTMSSGGGSYVLAGQTISSVASSVTSTVNAPILIRGNFLTLNAAAGTVPSGVDLSITGNLNQYDASDAVIKNGAGTVRFGGTGNYYGATTINAGTLALASTALLPNTTNFAIAAGATLDVSAVSGFTLNSVQAVSGSGTVNGSVADNGGSQFSPGGFNTVGTLSITTNLTLAGGDTLNFDFSAGGSNDVINVGGTFSPVGYTAINLANWPTGGFQQTNYVLIQAASLGGSADNFYLQNVPTGGRQTYSIVYNTSTSPQQVLLQVSGYNASLVWGGGSGNTWDVQVTQDWLNGSSADYFYTSDNVLFSNVPPANAAVNITPTSIAPGTVVVNSTNNYVFTGGYITGSAGLVKNGSGSVTLTTANDYAGGTTINAGRLVLGDGVANNGSIVGAIANNAVLVISNSSSQALNNNISGSGQTVAGGTIDLALSGNISGAQQVVGNDVTGVTLSGTNSYTGGTVVSNGLLTAVNATALGAPASGVLATVNGGATLAYQVGGTQTFTNPIVGAGSLVYSNATPGSLANGLAGLKLAVSNSFSGGLVIKVGSVYAYDPHALGSGPVTIDNGNIGGGGYYNQLFVGNGLNISNAITVVNAADYFDGVIMVDPGVNNSYGASDTNGGTFSGPITVAVGVTVQHGGLFCGPGGGTNWLVIAGPVTNLNSGGGISSRNGRTRFSGGGDYSSFTVSGGTSQIGANNGICTNALLQLAGGSFDLNGYSQTFTGLANPGAGSVNNSSTNYGTLTFDLTSYNSYSSVIAGNLNLVLNGSAILSLTGTNTYKGNTTVNGGTLELAVASLATNSTVSVASGALLQLDFSGTNQVGALVLNGVSQPAGIYDSTSAASYLTGSGSLKVISTIASNPTNLTFTVTGSTGTLSWPADHLGWLVQSNSVNLAVPANWQDISNTVSGTNYIFTIDPAKGNVFYRLRHP